MLGDHRGTQGDPTVTPSTYVQRHWATFAMPGGKACPHIPGPLPPPSHDGVPCDRHSEHMLEVYVSAAVPSCFLWTLFSANRLQYVVTQVVNAVRATCVSQQHLHLTSCTTTTEAAGSAGIGHGHLALGNPVTVRSLSGSTDGRQRWVTHIALRPMYSPFTNSDGNSGSARTCRRPCRSRWLWHLGSGAACFSPVH